MCAELKLTAVMLSGWDCIWKNSSNEHTHHNLCMISCTRRQNMAVMQLQMYWTLTFSF